MAILRWLGLAPALRPDLKIVVYTRASCPLCDEAWSLLQAYQEKYQFEMTAQDVDESPDLVCDYGECVPVVAINGQVRFRGHVNEVLLRRILGAK
jgi:glutaredoxin